jgi:hypothetical protein
VDRPTTYVIEVQGAIPSALAAELAPLTIDVGVGGATTLLRGPVADTAALYGLLARLESVGVALVAVRPVPEQSLKTEGHQPYRLARGCG